MRRLIENSIRSLLICGLLKVAFCGDGEQFRMENVYNEDTTETNSHVSWYVASERRSVECGGVFKRLQNEVQSPDYPEVYGEDLHCEYTFKSPFVCSSRYHFQFVDFELEPSRDCRKDRLVIGDEEVLCGTVIGSKTYNSSNGILTMKFVTDGWGSGRGFRIVVTRQPCDDNEAVESSTSYTVDTTLQVADDQTIASDEEVIIGSKKVNSRQDIPPEFNPSGYLPPGPSTPPSYPTNTCPPYIPSYPVNPGYPIGPTCRNCPGTPNYTPNCQNYPQPCYPSYPAYPSYPNNPVYPASPSYPTNPIYPTKPVYPNYPPNNGGGTNSIGGAPPGYQPPQQIHPDVDVTLNVTDVDHPQRQDIPPPPILPPANPTILSCCRNVFSQQRFYLVSPNFPSFETSNANCYYHINRYSPNTCRLIIRFKYFLLGDDRIGCSDAFVEIDGRRICGCRTGMVYTSQWGYLPKFIRVYSRYNRFPRVQGFVLDIYQEPCPPRYTRNIAQNRIDVQPSKPANITTVETNTSSRYTYYFYNMEDEEPLKPQETILQAALRVPEGPSSKFFYPTNVPQYGSCSFTSLDLLRLKLESLWISKPRCY
ncbi:uncharacterized protein LOC120419667 [Culex pipiens pallens]|uniref:uncharacterized protein LOC120419667 n=1 Tax=Culex pipiens pallens TaxID=42434 RepID=UPI0019530ADA|nr:uncharacterized protein LOC120419667 [Culex pipiens pallens]